MKPKLHTLGRPEILATNTVMASPQAILTQGMQIPVPTSILQYGIPAGTPHPDACTA